MRLVTFETIKACNPCWGDKRLRKLVGDGLRPGAGLAKLLALEPADARWLLSRLLDVGNRAAWAKACAERAKGYAANAADAADAARYAARAAADAYAASYAASAARYASYASYAAASANAAASAAAAAADTARYAADTARYAADAADAYAYAASYASYAAYAASDAASDAAKAEHKLACVLGLELLCEQHREAERCEGEARPNASRNPITENPVK